MLKNSKLSKVLSMIIALSMLMSMFTFTASAENIVSEKYRDYVMRCYNSGKTIANKTNSTGSETNNSHVIYYVFDNIEYASKLKELKFTGKTTSMAYCPTNILYFVTDEEFPKTGVSTDWQDWIVSVTKATNKGGTITNSSKTKPLGDAVKLFTSTYTAASTSEVDNGDGTTTTVTTPASFTGDITYDSTTNEFTCDLDGLTELKDGQTLLIAINRTGNKVYYNSGTLSFADIDMDTFNEEVLVSVNTVADKTEMAAFLETYKDTIGISDIIANIADDAEAQEAVAEKLLANILANGDYADFAAVASDYQAAYNEVYIDMILKRINEAADAEALSGYLTAYKDNLGIADAYTVAETGEVLTSVAADVFANRPETGYADFAAVAAQYEASLNNVIVNLVNTAADAEALSAVITKFYARIGATDTYNNAVKYELLTATAASLFTATGSFESIEAVAEAFANAYQTEFDKVFVQNIKYVDQVYTKSTDADSEYVLYTGTGATTKITNTSIYYVFNNIQDTESLKKLEISYYSNAGGTWHNSKRTVKYYIGDGTVTDTASIESFIASGSLTSISHDFTLFPNAGVNSFEISDLTINKGQTLVVQLPGVNINTYFATNAASTANKPQLKFTINRAELEANALSAVNTATTAEELQAALNTYDNIIGIDYSKYEFAKDKINEALITDTDFTSLAEIAEAYNAAYEATYAEKMTNKTVYVDMVYTKTTDEGSEYKLHTDSGAPTAPITNNSIYYVFNNVTDGSFINALKISFYSNAGGTWHNSNRTVKYYIGDGTITDDASTIESFIANSEVTSISHDFTQFPEAGINTLDISKLEIADGQTLVVQLPGVNINTYFATNYAQDANKPQLNYDIDEASQAAAVLEQINAIPFGDVEAVKTLFTKYASVIKINPERIAIIPDSELEVFTGASVEEGGTPFASLDEVKSIFVEYVEEHTDWESHTVTVTSDARQTFTGFGYTSSTSTLKSVTDEAYKEEILTDAIDGVNFRTMKLWVNMGACVDENGDVDLTRYLKSYNLESYDQSVGYAKAHGIKDIIFGPTGTPSHLLTNGYLPEENRAAYGELIADVINEMITAYEVPITMTSIVNESNLGMNSAAEFAPIITALRARLDEHGLNYIKIVAPEHANVNSGLETFYTTLRDSYPEAYAAVDYIAVHSYNMSLTNSFGNMLWKDGKAIISTESCVEGKATADNTTNAASITARALNDMNNGTTLWTHFHAFGFNNDATSLVRYNTSTKVHETTASYDYIKLLSNNFTDGTVMRKSKLDGSNISFTYAARKPKMTVAAGVDKNGKWNIAMVNNTDDGRSFAQYGFATYPDTYMEVTLTIEELSDVAEKKFVVYGTDNQISQTIKFINGVAEKSIRVYPRELVMLTEVTDDTSKVIYSNIKDGKAYIRVSADNAMTGVYGEYAGDSFIGAKVYNLTEGVNVVNETVSENADSVMVMSVENASSLKPNMDKFSCDITKTAE